MSSPTAPPAELIEYYEILVGHIVNSTLSVVPSMFRPKQPPVDVTELARMFARSHVLYDELKTPA